MANHVRWSSGPVLRCLFVWKRQLGALLKVLGYMLFRIWEVAVVLAAVFALVVAKHIPAFEGLPLSQINGILCFSFAIFLCLRIYMAELARIRAE